MSSPRNVFDTLYAVYRPHTPARNDEKFFAILDAPRGSNPCDPRDPNPNPQSIADAIESLDNLIDPYHPLPPEQRKIRGEIRKAALEQVWSRNGNCLHTGTQQAKGK